MLWYALASERDRVSVAPDFLIDANPTPRLRPWSRLPGKGLPSRGSMDAELLLLQQQLFAVQETKSAARLSERNVVELVGKLRELGLLGDDLLHSLDGKEYITQERLQRDMERQILHQGRVSLVDLAALLNVDLFYCERASSAILASASADTATPGLKGVQVVQGEIVTQKYWDELAEEVDATLQTAGQLAISELARRFNFSAELLLNVIQKRLGKLVHGKLESGQLYTSAYVARVKALVRGGLRGAAVATPASDVWTILQHILTDSFAIANSSIGDTRIGEERAECVNLGVSGVGKESGGGVTSGGMELALFSSVLAECIAEGALSGALKGGGVTWVPSAFAKLQKESLTSFFAQNGYVKFGAERKQSVAQTQHYLQEVFPEAIMLDTVAVHPSQLHQADAAVEEAVTTDSWCDVANFLPSVLSTADCAKLLPSCPYLQSATKAGAARVFAPALVVSNSLIKSIVARLQAVARERAEAAQPADKEKLLKGTVDREAQARPSLPQGSALLQKKGSAAKGGSRVAEEDDEEEEPFAKKGGKGGVRGTKGKGKGGAAGGKSKEGAKGKEPRGVASSKDTARDDEAALSVSSLVPLVIEWYPSLGDVFLDSDDHGSEEDQISLAEKLVQMAMPAVLAAFQEARQAAFTASAEERRRLREWVQQELDTAFANTQLYSRALPLFSQDADLQVLLTRHLLRTSGTELADLALFGVLWEHDLVSVPAASASVQPGGSDGTSVSGRAAISKGTILAQVAGDRASLCRKLPGTAGGEALGLVEALEGRDVEGFLLQLEQMAEEQLGMRLRRLDKKNEKALTFSAKKALMGSVEVMEDTVGALPLLVALAFTQVHGRILQAPGRALAAVVKFLSPSLPLDLQSKLAEYQALVVSCLVGEAGSREGDTTQAENQAELAGRLPELKKMVLELRAKS